jgi:RNA polymerase sigma-70 factor (ECF subfamily)
MVKSLRAGHEHAYATLFSEHYRPLTIFALKYVNDLDTSRELVQDLFVSIYETRKSLIITTSLRSYLYQAVRNRCLNHLQKTSVRRQYQEQDRENRNPNESLEDQILVNELEHRIFLLISQLSPKCQEVFILSRVKGLKNKEIARELGISIRTVETHISYALKILREKLGSEYKF